MKIKKNQLRKIILEEFSFPIIGKISNKARLIIESATSQLTIIFPLINFTFNCFEYFHKAYMEYRKIRLKIGFLIVHAT